ncbi:hypothetical protein [Sphingomonas bacterium]|uniref:hypothetical protein n=1 Tax=Sphingomonas bacterium TaxID=1895847 RepID=UPI0015750E82|nr:hypothetical protein [Sphingomonas bacterium]
MGDQISIECCITEPSVESFAIDCARDFAPNLYGDMLDTGVRTIRFPLGEVAGWGPRWSLPLGSNKSDTVDKIIRGLDIFAFPLMSTINSDETFYKTLKEDINPFPWHYSNHALRAAQFVYMHLRIGEEEDEAEALLMPFRSLIENSLFNAELGPYLKGWCSVTALKSLDQIG